MHIIVTRGLPVVPPLILQKCAFSCVKSFFWCENRILRQNLGFFTAGNICFRIFFTYRQNFAKKWPIGKILLKKMTYRQHFAKRAFSCVKSFFWCENRILRKNLGGCTVGKIVFRNIFTDRQNFTKTMTWRQNFAKTENDL